jgi:D-arginine dehydrogenase
MGRVAHDDRDARPTPASLMAETFDAVVIGGGIAGVAVASELARDRSVLVLEMESGFAHHTTGRSAAAWIAGYGGPTVSPFANASLEWFRSDADGASDHRLLTRRGMLVVSESPDDDHYLDEYFENNGVEVDRETALELFPAVRPERCHRAVYDESVQDLDVMGAFATFRRLLLERGGSLEARAPMQSAERADGRWRISAGDHVIESAILVDAAGAWADDVAASAGLAPIGLQPLRRTMASFAGPADVDATAWPLLLDAAEHFYTKPEGTGFMASPADETPQEPGDARPSMDDVATALDEVRVFTTLDPRSVRSSWAGLRTFAPDRAMVLGPDPAQQGFAWFAGLGGFGIMACPAAARSVVSLIDSGRLPDDVIAAGGNAADVVPDRLTVGGTD